MKPNTIRIISSSGDTSRTISLSSATRLLDTNVAHKVDGGLRDSRENLKEQKFNEQSNLFFLVLENRSWVGIFFFFW